MTQLTEPRESLSEHLRMAVSAGNIGIWELDTVTGAAWRNLKHDQIFGYEELLESWTFDDFIAHVVESDREKVHAAYDDAINNGEEWAFECQILRADGLVRWISAHGKLLPEEGGANERMIGHVIDITELKRGEEHLRLVTAELNHRLQNIIGTISSLIHLSSRQDGNRVEIGEALQARLAAIGRSHNLTFQDHSARVAISEVVESEITASVALAEHFEVAVDPALQLRGQVAERLTLVFHELMTNAIKYGALSTEEGKVHITSSLHSSGDVELCWRERGGPPVKPQRTEGFGSQLMRSALSADARIEQAFPPEGLVCRILFPADSIFVKE